MTGIQLGDLIARAATGALASQRRDGSFPSGRNGPYQDPETPVRTTAHWLIVLLKAYERTGLEKFRRASRRAAGFLTSLAARPHGASFLCRLSPHKDGCNGLIGQAWAIEALAAAAHGLGDAAYRDHAADVFLRHEFDAALGLWHRLHVDGRTGTLDLTFNHQVWFAAAGSLIDRHAPTLIGPRVRRFLDRADESHFRIRPSGLIRHKIRSPGGGALAGARRRLSPATLARQEIGYHAYNLYGLALLRRRFRKHALWASPRLQAALRFVTSDEHVRGLTRNEFAYPYNPVGFEAAFALQTFGTHPGGSRRTPGWWMREQLKHGHRWDAPPPGAIELDPVTAAARIYEATRLRGA
jgi:hypothetical protein